MEGGEDGEAWERRKIESVFCEIIGLLKSEKKDEVGQTYQKASVKGQERMGEWAGGG